MCKVRTPNMMSKILRLGRSPKMVASNLPEVGMGVGFGALSLFDLPELLVLADLVAAIAASEISAAQVSSVGKSRPLTQMVIPALRSESPDEVFAPSLMSLLSVARYANRLPSFKRTVRYFVSSFSMTPRCGSFRILSSQVQVALSAIARIWGGSASV